MNFSEKIIEWYAVHQRDLPWRKTTDPYKIWLSEIILQQTRVEQGQPYYEKFIETFPTVHHLAEAPEEQVLKLWQGLGYYSRARNLHTSAKQVVNEYGGKLPQSFKELLKLKGVGKYTAAAIASFSYHERVPVVDGNVYRLLSRYFGVDQPIDTSKGQKYFFDLAKQLISEEDPATFNQAIMEFGALFCTPKTPNCNGCIFSDSCEAKKQKNTGAFPVKKGKVSVKKLYLHYMVFTDPKNVILRKRGDQSIWANLYDFPCIESDLLLGFDEVLARENWLKQAAKSKEISLIKTYKHLLSHRSIEAKFYEIKVDTSQIILREKWIKIPKKKLVEFPVSKLVDKFWHYFSKEQAVGKQKTR